MAFKSLQQIVFFGTLHFRQQFTRSEGSINASLLHEAHEKFKSLVSSFILISLAFSLLRFPAVSAGMSIYCQENLEEYFEAKALNKEAENAT